MLIIIAVLVISFQNSAVDIRNITVLWVFITAHYTLNITTLSQQWQAITANAGSLLWIQEELLRISLEVGDVFFWDVFSLTHWTKHWSTALVPSGRAAESGHWPSGISVTMLEIHLEKKWILSMKHRTWRITIFSPMRLINSWRSPSDLSVSWASVITSSSLFSTADSRNFELRLIC